VAYRTGGACCERRPFVAALAEKSIAPSHAPAHRTGRDHFGHPALGRVSRAAFAGASRAGPRLAVAYSARWSLLSFAGVARLTPIPLPSAPPSAPRTRAPSLHWRYPASSVLWAPPTPAAPIPRRDRYQVAPASRQASRVASHRVRTCCAHYPGEQGNLLASVDPIAPGGLRPMRGDSALASKLSGPAQASLALRPVRSRPAQGGSLSPGLRRLGRPHRRPGSSQGGPTPPWTGLAPAALTGLDTAHSHST